MEGMILNFEATDASYLRYKSLHLTEFWIRGLRKVAVSPPEHG